jgi:3-deoxy-manno-octulosonate cytidylyltransferase (CMP-KDO synthetase)
MTTTLTIIPARLASTRFPNKPLADICGKPMILHVVDQAVAAQLGPVIVASGDPEITQIVRSYGVPVIETAPDLPSGTDRIFTALTQFDPDGQFQRIINLQGDLPTCPPAYLQQLNQLLDEDRFDMVTLACPISNQKEAASPHVVKAVLSIAPGTYITESIYFTRNIVASSDGHYYHHIGLYGFKRSSLEQYISLPPSPLEVYERLEQLRFLENGMRIGVGLVNQAPHGIDTKEDLERLRFLLHDDPIITS